MKSFTYSKNKNKKLFNSMKNKMDIEEVQNYIPIYDVYFNLNDKNYNSINLNNDTILKQIGEKIDYNNYNCLVEYNNKIIRKNVFFKFSPLLDPAKFMVDKYKKSYNLFSLPSISKDEKIHPKVHDSNNSAYVDGFFYHLSSQLLSNYNMINCNNFYGSYVGIKNSFNYNIVDDLEQLVENEQFFNNKDKLFNVDSDVIDFSPYYNQTRKFKNRLNIDSSFNTNIVELSDICDLSYLDVVFKNNTEQVSTNYEVDVLFEYDLSNCINKKNKNEDSNSRCSSRTSETSNSDEVSSCDTECEEIEITGEVIETTDDNIIDDASDSNENNNQEDSDEETDDEEEIEEIIATIHKFPVHIISMEKYENTMDSLIMDNMLREKEWETMILQILFTLITYQKCYSFTHNDLHTNNVMYNSTKQKYIYYKHQNNIYKVPTYGKVFKIIDFGRSIYKFRGETICSDSFHPKGDAATQYNFEPYFNNKKPRLEPNKSFDLCRLGCSLYNYIDNLSEKENDIYDVMLKWCLDDKERNVLYKSNGEERYPDFKLYKMIVRTVHNHIPSEVIKNKVFEKYIYTGKIPISANIMNIDELPCFV